jgi:hypothetical protein
MKNIIFILMLVLLSSFVFATEPEFYFEQGEIGELNIFCFENNNSLCVGASCSITIFYPNKTLMIDNNNMADTGTYFNYNITNTYTEGIYPTTIICSGTESGFDDFTYEVTTDGKGHKDTDSTTSISITLFLLLIAGTLFYFGFRPNKSNKKYLEFIIKRSCLLVGIYFTVLVSSIMANFSIYANLGVKREMFLIMEIFGWAGYIAMLILVVGSIFRLLAELKHDKHKDRFGDNYDE